MRRRFWVAACVFVAIFVCGRTEWAQPQLLVPDLGVRIAASGLDQPTAIAFLAADELLVIEKATGKVKRVVGGSVRQTVLDLAINNSSERGLLGIALHPDFPTDPGVYLFWTCLAPPPRSDDPYFPTMTECRDEPALGDDSDDILGVPLLGNRVDRFVWDGSSLVFEGNLLKLRAFQNDGGPEPQGQGDAGQPPAGNNNGGVLKFGADGKLYVVVGDTGRRGQLQNLPSGPTQTGLGDMVPDDQFGWPEPENAHFTGVVIRINDDGTIPADNPFFALGATVTGGAKANIQRIYAYGIRNSFGMDFDPVAGHLWVEENGDNAFDELNLVSAGSNSGWLHFMGPTLRVPEYKNVEMTVPPNTLQQWRWPPWLLTPDANEAFSQLFVLRGSVYSDPEFSWRYSVAPGGIGFLRGTGLGPEYDGDLFVGASRTELDGGFLFRFELTDDRQEIRLANGRSADRVADNFFNFDVTESEEFRFGKNFGVVRDIQTAPNGNLYVVSTSQGAIYEIFRKQTIGRD